jgi:hypothetical protein
MSYQAVIRNASNALVSNAPVKMRISILQGSTTGTAVYSELHSASTNANGLVSIEIGAGTSPAGNFSTINWGNGTYYLKTETDPNNGTNYSIVGTSQLLSVPYALNASNAGNGINKISTTGDTVYLDNGDKYIIPGIKKVGNPPSTINNGLVAYYPFNGNANDESGNGRNGTIYGNVNLTQDRKGINNSAYDWPNTNSGFNSNSYIDLPNMDNNFGNSLSISMWVLKYSNPVQIDPRIFGRGESGIIGYLSSSRLKLYIGIGIGLDFTNPLGEDQWIHIAYTVDGNLGLAKFYINGVVVHSYQGGAPVINPLFSGSDMGTTPWNLGRKSISAFNGWGGKLDEVRFYNRALTQEEITYLYNN